MSHYVVLILLVLASACGFVLGRITAPDVIIERAAVRTVAAATAPIFECQDTRDQLSDANDRANQCAAKLGRQQDDLAIAQAKAQAAIMAQILAEEAAIERIKTEQSSNEEVRNWSAAAVPAVVAASLYADPSAACGSDSHGASAAGSYGSDCAAGSVSSPSD